MYQRVIIKISGEALADSEGKGYNRALIESIGEEVRTLVKSGVQPAIVTGAGNYWRGARSDHRVHRVNSDNMGMLATAMNALYIADCFETMGIDVCVMSSIQIGGVFEMFHRQKAIQALKDGRVLIFAYGTGHPYFSTDTSTALYGSEIDAEAVLALKFGVDGVYTKDPKKFDDAKLIEQITYDEIIANNDINVMDKAAACICRESGLKTIVFAFAQGNILKAAAGEKIGTLCQNAQ